MQDEWKLFTGWLIIVFILLASDCTNAPSIVPTTYELIEPLGTIHKYKKEPLVGKSYYCLIHEDPEVVYRLDSDSILTKRVRRWSVIR